MNDIKTIRKYTKAIRTATGKIAAKAICKPVGKTSVAAHLPVRTETFEKPEMAPIAHVVCKEYCTVDMDDNTLCVKASVIQLQPNYYPEVVAVMNGAGEGLLLYKKSVDYVGKTVSRVRYSTRFSTIPNTYALSILNA